MPETYDPRERSFIKKPEAKVCITCGHPLTPDVKPLTTHMNKYINSLTGKVAGVFNENKDELIIQDVKLIREDLYKAPSTAEVAKPTVPTVPTAPPVQTVGAAQSVNAPIGQTVKK